MGEIIHLKTTLIRITLEIGCLSCLACHKLCILLLKSLNFVVKTTEALLVLNSSLLEVLVLVLTTNQTLMTSL